ncbi:Addiction module toxin, RelE/StbE family (fragment) [Crenothrix polyspora]|uniref:Addiction module toxin, RelE/StbE family n=1 Tax=Crenothrix polyspora TaxID=360316 RepID=A0A1R4H8I5_9GAMM
MTQSVIISEPALLDLLCINDYYLLTVSDKTAAAIIDRLEMDNS